jgi:hypothetical protein
MNPTITQITLPIHDQVQDLANQLWLPNTTRSIHTTIKTHKLTSGQMRFKSQAWLQELDPTI